MPSLPEGEENVPVRRLTDANLGVSVQDLMSSEKVEVVEQELMLVVHLLVVLVVAVVMDIQLEVCLVDPVVHMEMMEVVVHPLQLLNITLVEEAVVPVL